MKAAFKTRKTSIALLLLVLLLLGGIAWQTLVYDDNFSSGHTVGLYLGVLGFLVILLAELLWVVRKRRSGWWIVRRALWLKSHIWLGFLGLFFCVIHSDLRWGGTLTGSLWMALIVTILSGLVGWFLQKSCPPRMSQRSLIIVTIEEFPARCEQLRKQMDRIIEAACGSHTLEQALQEQQPSENASVSLQLAQLYLEDVRPFLGLRYRKSSPFAHPETALMFFETLLSSPMPQELIEAVIQLQQACEERRQLQQQARFHWSLNAWLIVHVPASVLVIVFGAAHAYFALTF